MTITIKGEVPSKKNSKRILFNQRTHKPFIKSSVRHDEWHSRAFSQLNGLTHVSKLNRLSMTFYSASRRKADLTNRADSVQDLLVDAGILEDDNWWVIPELELLFGGVDKNNPRVEITFL